MIMQPCLLYYPCLVSGKTSNRIKPATIPNADFTDGTLSAREIAQLKLNADRIMLSRWRLRNPAVASDEL
jgi:hypothetical protein